MICGEFERALEALLEGTLRERELARCAGHLAVCASCRELIAPMGDALAPVASEPPPTFLQAVLAVTSGPACATARRGLCALVDGELDATDRALARGHLAECEDCRSDVEALRLLAAELPLMAEVVPDSAFLRDTLVASIPPDVVAIDVVAETWRRWMLRPRFALEAAYVGVALSCLIVLTPVRHLPGLLGEASRARAVASGIRSEAGILLDRASSLMEGAKTPASAEPVDPSSDPEEQP